MNNFSKKSENDVKNFSYWNQVKECLNPHFTTISEKITHSDRSRIQNIISNAYESSYNRCVETISLAFEIFEILKWWNIEDACLASRRVFGVGRPDLSTTGINISEILQYCSGFSGRPLMLDDDNRKVVPEVKVRSIPVKVARLIAGTLCAVHLSEELLALFDDGDSHPLALQIDRGDYHDLLALVERNRLASVQDILNSLKDCMESETRYLFSDDP